MQHIFDYYSLKRNFVLSVALRIQQVIAIGNVGWIIKSFQLTTLVWKAAMFLVNALKSILSDSALD